MAQPPRIPVLIPDHKEVIYFVTLCVENRLPVLANPLACTAFQHAIEKADRWMTLSAVLMPDHFHALVAPKNRSLSIGLYSAAIKRWTRQELKADWKWQKGCFDRLLRNNETAQAKWAYLRENPVRAGLVSHWEKWPYSWGFSL